MLRKVKLISAEGATYISIGGQPNNLVNHKKQSTECATYIAYAALSEL